MTIYSCYLTTTRGQKHISICPRHGTELAADGEMRFTPALRTWFDCFARDDFHALKIAAERFGALVKAQP